MREGGKVKTMKLEQRSLFSAACVAALVVSAGSASLGCNRNHVDRDGFAERNFDYVNGEKDKSGAGDANTTAVGTTTVTGAEIGTISNDLAVSRIVAARCARETSCNNVGPDKHFVDHDVCAREVHAKIASDLDRNQCPRGIDSPAVDKCMDAIRAESCNNPIDTISRLAACRSSDMCLKAETKSEPTKKR
ncbi:MAG: hypothetical protein JWO86_4413 [Myxococcaceae bacterium]|nr:hypothetical protein [Myxococcaceae bacterium]